MISTKLDVAVLEAIHDHAVFQRRKEIAPEEALQALRKVSSDLLATITNLNERARIFKALVDELQRAAPWQSSERGQGQLRAEDVHRSPSMVDIAEGGRAVAGRLALTGGETDKTCP